MQRTTLCFNVGSQEVLQYKKKLLHVYLTIICWVYAYVTGCGWVNGKAASFSTKHRNNKIREKSHSQQQKITEKKNLFH